MRDKAYSGQVTGFLFVDQGLKGKMQLIERSDKGQPGAAGVARRLVEKQHE